MILALALTILRSYIKNPKKSAVISKQLAELRDLLNAMDLGGL